MSHPSVRGVVVITRNGDRTGYYQDPKTYEGSDTECTPLGEVQSFKLGQYLRNEYFNEASPNYIRGVRTDLVNLDQVHARVKAGYEGRATFDSAIALLQGLFPPTQKNSILLANETLITAPLGGYQYVAVETVEPSNDRSLESWTDCPEFTKHVESFYSSADFKKKSQEAQRFYHSADDFLFGRPATLENAVNVYDYMNHQLTHNKTYAHRLPPTFIEQARHWANYHENGVFSDPDMYSIGNIAGRTVMHSVLEALKRITYDGDDLQFLVHSTTYQPFISFFTMTDIAKEYPGLAAIPNFASAIAIELRRGSLPDNRDFLRIRFKNGTDDAFTTVHAFGHHGDIPLTEFIYRIENSVVGSNGQWQRLCGAKERPWIPSLPFTGNGIEQRSAAVTASYGALFAALLMFFVFLGVRVTRRVRKQRIRLEGLESHPVANSAADVHYTDAKRPAATF